MSKIRKLLDAAPAVARFLRDVAVEYDSATKKHGGFNSAHEGFAVLWEEVDELWDEVRKRRSNRDLGDMRKECVQIAAMAMKFALYICKEPA